MADPPVDIEIRGVHELERGMDRLGHNVEQAAEAAFRTTADQAATLVRSKVPKRSGRLASSVAGESSPQGGSVGMGDGVPYAGWIEFGGGHGRPYIAAGRYLYPTAMSFGPTLKRTGEDTVKREIRSMLWPTPSPL